MTKKKTVFGLCSSAVAAAVADGTTMNYESRALIQEAESAFDEVVLIHPWHVRYAFRRADATPHISMRERHLDDLSCLVVRGTGGHEHSISVLVRALRRCGCFVLDPDSRFSGEAASKLLTTVDRHEKSVGTDSYYAFSIRESLTLIEELSASNSFPLLYKPVRGKQGRDVVVVRTHEEAIRLVHDFFNDADAQDAPLFLQSYMNFVAEYRVMLVGTHVIGVVQKCRGQKQIASNAARGGVFTAVDVPEVVEFAVAYVDQEGILGIDVALDSENHLHVIEANRAPLWEEFERATGVNVAKEIVSYARQHCD